MKADKIFPAGAGKRFGLVCDTQSIIISILRYSMKDAPLEEILRYCLGRVLSAPFLPLRGKGCVFIFNAEKESFMLAAEIGLSPADKKRCGANFKDCPCRGAANSRRISAVKCPLKRRGESLCVPLVYRERLVGVMNLFLKGRGAEVSEAEEGFLSAAANALAGVLVQKNAEREAAAVRRELRSARRLADIGALSASVAHELRSPLAVIKMAASNLRRKSKDPSLDKHLLNIEKKVFECDRIISNLLFYARLKKPALEKTRLYDIILESIQDSVKTSGKRGVSVKKNLSPVRDVTVNIDPVRMKEVFTNILVNAFESVENPGGQVSVKARVEKDGGAAVIFEDTGRGISRDLLREIFSPFFTTKSRGNGLGLTVAERMVKMHGGSIEVESREGEGSVFTVRLPSRQNNEK